MAAAPSFVGTATVLDSTGDRTKWTVRPFIRTTLDDKRVRFIVAGAANTGFGFGCFVLYQQLIGVHWGYMWALALTHCTSVLFAFATHRSLVFKVTGNLLRDLWRFESVYLAALAINAVLLPLMVQLGHTPVVVAQALITCVNVSVSWLGHSRFSFRRSAAGS